MLVNSLPNENGVLVALPPSVRDRLRPSLKSVRLVTGSTLYDISSTSDHAWFITSGIKLWVRVQISGEALQIDARTLQNIIRQESAFHILLFKYMHTLSGQIAVTGACNRFHKAEQRLARWLLTARDRVSSDSMALTQGDMGLMLGISRSRVSSAVRSLQKKGLIHYLHGHVSILNREGLEDASCGCHRAIRRAIGWILPP